MEAGFYRRDGGFPGEGVVVFAVGFGHGTAGFFIKGAIGESWAILNGVRGEDVSAEASIYIEGDGGREGFTEVDFFARKVDIHEDGMEGIFFLVCGF